MKRLLSLILCLGIASIVAVEAKDKDKGAKKYRKTQEKVFKRQAKAARNEVKSERKNNRAFNRGRALDRAGIEAVVTPSPVGRNFDRGVRNNVRANITRRGPANFSWDYSEARSRFNRGVRRDRGYYRSRYNRFALFAGGYYYFDRGYWYPAYGYDSAYSTYRFDEPIYGYNSLDPSQVIVNVQRELRREGYYRDSIDGLIGPNTRAALARYQRERGLSVTRAIDGPTLASLGLT